MHAIHSVDARDRVPFRKVEQVHSTAELPSKENLLYRAAKDRLGSHSGSYKTAVFPESNVPALGTGIGLHREPKVLSLAHDSGCRVINPMYVSTLSLSTRIRIRKV